MKREIPRDWRQLVKKSFLSSIVLLSLLLFARNAEALRCGNALIREGNSKLEVMITLERENCGAVISKERYYPPERFYKRYEKHRGTSKKIRYERWLIRVKSGWGGDYYCYELIFDDARLIETETGKKCN